MERFNLPEGWHWKTILELAHPEGRPIVSGPFGSNIGSRFFVDEGIPVIRGSNLTKDAERLKEREYVYITEEKADELGNVDAIAGDLIFTAAGTLGQVGIIEKTSRFNKYVISNKQLRARLNQAVADPLYCFYWLSSSTMVNYITQQNTGSTVPLINLSVLKALEIPLPPLVIQKAIAQVLRTLDDKIELNRQTNKTLESIARAIFKSWFIDFDPVKAKRDGKTADLSLSPEILNLFPDSFQESELGEIPFGWEVASIDDVCDFQNGYAFKSKDIGENTANSYKVFKMGNIKKGGGLKQASRQDYAVKENCDGLDRYIIKKGDLLMCMTDMKSSMALLGHTALMNVDDQYILNQRVGLLRSKNIARANFPFLYILTNDVIFIEELRSRANSGVQVNLSTKEIKDTKFILPTEKIHLLFDKLAIEFQEKIFINEAEQNTLSNLRNTLLPKLISGELRIKDAEKFLKDAPL